MTALTAHGAKAVIEQGRVRLVCSEPLPAELIETARAHKDGLRALLEARRDHFDQRAAILEFDEGLSRAEAEAIARRKMVASVYNDMQAARDPGSYASALAALRAECPAYVLAADWQQAIEDGHRFVTRWGKHAEALGWAPADLFGLHIPPEKPVPNYRRLSRYDQTGLIWLLHGRPVIALTETAATILAQSGANLTYRRYIKPAPAAGDCLDYPRRTEADGQPAGQGCSHLARPYCAGGRRHE
jgi:hypothetical protein